MADLVILKSDYSPLKGQALEICQTKARLPQSPASSQVQHNDTSRDSKLRGSAESVTLNGKIRNG
jgi:hypothetical protein